MDSHQRQFRAQHTTCYLSLLHPVALDDDGNLSSPQTSSGSSLLLMLCGGSDFWFCWEQLSQQETPHALTSLRAPRPDAPSHSGSCSALTHGLDGALGPSPSCPCNHLLSLLHHLGSFSYRVVPSNIQKCCNISKFNTKEKKKKTSLPPLATRPFSVPHWHQRTSAEASPVPSPSDFQPLPVTAPFWLDGTTRDQLITFSLKYFVLGHYTLDFSSYPSGPFFAVSFAGSSPSFWPVSLPCLRVQSLDLLPPLTSPCLHSLEGVSSGPWLHTDVYKSLSPAQTPSLSSRLWGYSQWLLTSARLSERFIKQKCCRPAPSHQRLYPIFCLSVFLFFSLPQQLEWYS